MKLLFLTISVPLSVTSWTVCVCFVTALVWKWNRGITSHAAGLIINSVAVQTRPREKLTPPLTPQLGLYHIRLLSGESGVVSDAVSCSGPSSQHGRGISGWHCSFKNTRMQSEQPAGHRSMASGLIPQGVGAEGGRFIPHTSHNHKNETKLHFRLGIESRNSSFSAQPFTSYWISLGSRWFDLFPQCFLKHSR